MGAAAATAVRGQPRFGTWQPLGVFAATRPAGAPPGRSGRHSSGSRWFGPGPLVGREYPMFRMSLAALAAAALVTTPVLAQTSTIPADAVQRSGAETSGESQLAGGPILPPILAATIIVLGVLMATGVIFDNDDETPLVPVSP